MPARRRGGAFCLLGSLFLFGMPISLHAQQTSPSPDTHKPSPRHVASSQTRRHGRAGHHVTPHELAVGHHGNKSYFQRTSYHASTHASSHVIQCVPFARAASGIDLRGDALTWWDKAAGVYARGSRPEPGSVLAFRANRAMRLGHVAVVKKVINSREIEIDQAHWGQNRVSRNIAVIDVSPANDWTAVRVALDNQGKFGSIYPTHGFIYDRQIGENFAAAGEPRALPLNPAPRDLRTPAEQRAIPVLTSIPVADEVAEAPAYGDLAADAPERSLR